MADATRPHVLIVDDDAGQRGLLASFLSSHGFGTTAAASGEEALARLAEKRADLMISDIRMPGLSGLETFRRARAIRPDLPVVLVTGFANVRDAVGAMRDGAFGYLEKPIDLDELLALARLAIGVEEPAPPDAGRQPPPPDGVVAESPAMRDVLREIALAAPTDARILVTGESGTGKEVVADLVHAWSRRAGGPLVKVNCAALPEALLESELFGHEKGAFTGAVEMRVGRFEDAHGGTIFLDEIGELPAALQAKLLRVIEHGSFHRVGSNTERRTDARLIAATNRDLEAEVTAGRFRDDLYYRLNVIEIHLPPLRERPADVLPLASAFGRRFANETPRLSSAAAACLAAYAWPGNVRELRNAMERAVLLARGGTIMPEHLTRRITHTANGAAGADAPAAAEGGGRLAEVEQSLILQTLREKRYNRSETARTLGISRRALLYKLRRLAEQGHAIDPH